MANSPQAFLSSPYHTNSIVLADDFKTTSETSYFRFNKDVVRRSNEQTNIQRNALKKMATQLTPPFQIQMSAKDKQRKENIRAKWGMRIDNGGAVEATPVKFGDSSNPTSPGKSPCSPGKRSTSPGKKSIC